VWVEGAGGGGDAGDKRVKRKEGRKWNCGKNWENYEKKKFMRIGVRVKVEVLVAVVVMVTLGNGGG